MSIQAIDDNSGLLQRVRASDGNLRIANFVWDTNTLSWIKQTQSAGGGAASDVTVLNASLPVTGTFWQATQPVSIASMPSTPVTGTFWQATQPVSLASTTITGSVAVTGPLTDAQIRATPVPVSGTVSTGGLTDTQLRASAVPISGTVTANTGLVQGLTDTQLRASTVPVSLASTTVTGTVATTQTGNPTSSISSTASSLSSQTLRAANSSRKGLSIFNDSTAILYVKLGATASNSSFTIKMAAGSYYELPFNYTGIIDGVWAAANGSAYVTEIS